MKALLKSSENKGGAGKSTIVALTVETLRARGASLCIVDCDSANSATKAVYSDAEFIDLQSSKAAGSLVRLFERPVDYVVMDIGARDEPVIKKHFADMREAAKATKSKIIALRPITLNVAVHNNVAAYVKGYCDGEISSAIFFRSLACGRDEVGFSRRWNEYKWRADAIKNGRAVEIDFDDLGAEYAENLPALATPLQDIVLGKFNETIVVDGQREKLLELCNTIYDLDARSHIGLWLRRNGARLRGALGTLGLKI